MNKALSALFLMFAFVLQLHATETVMDEARLQELKAKNMVLQDPVLTIKGVIEKPESYMIKLEAKSPQGSQFITAFLDKNTSELYIGSAYDKEGNAIVFPQDKKVISEGVAFSYGKGEDELYIVTDPECVYCNKFEHTITGKLDDFKIHVILYPLPFHKKAPVMIEWIMQGKDDVERKARFDALMLKDATDYAALSQDASKPFAYSPPVQTYMDKSNLATLELNVRGTPSIYDADFAPVLQEELLEELK